MAPKQQLQEEDHWSAWQHGRRMQWRKKREDAGQASSLPPCHPAHSGSVDEAEEELLRKKYGKSQGASPPVYVNQTEEEMEVAMHDYTLAGSFGPARHVFMVMGRPVVVKGDEFIAVP